MDAELFRMIQADQPQFNPRICEGYVMEAMEKDLDYLDRILKCADEGFPSYFRYVDIRRVSVEEDLRETFGKKGNNDGRREFDIAESDLYPVDIHFIYKQQSPAMDIPIVKRMYLPYVGEAGKLMLAGTVNVINAVLGDPIISPSDREVFVMVNRAKFSLERMPYPVHVNRETIHTYCVTAPVYNGQPDKTPESRFLPKTRATTGHYLFCKYGVTEAFKRFYDVNVQIMETDIAQDQYDSAEYTIITSKFESGRVKPPDYKRKGDYFPNRLALVFSTEDIVRKPGITVLAAHFFYVLDHYPEMDLEFIDQTDTWRVTMGYVLFRSTESEGKLLNKVDGHLESLDTYVDAEARVILQDMGINTGNIYDLFSYMNDHITDLMTSSDPGNMWEKYLLVLRYVLSGVTEGIFNLTWNLQREKGVVPLKKLQRILALRLKPHAFLHTRQGHGEITSVQYPGDCYLLKFTCNAIRQTNAVVQPGGKRKVINTNDKAYHLHPSILQCGSMWNFPKGSPDGRTKINPFAMIDGYGKFLENMQFRVLMQLVAEETSTY